jgi:hypothetical protein
MGLRSKAKICNGPDTLDIEDKIIGVVGCVRMIHVGGNGGGNFRALTLFHSVEKANALNLVGMLIA